MAKAPAKTKTPPAPAAAETPEAKPDTSERARSLGMGQKKD